MGRTRRSAGIAALAFLAACGSTSIRAHRAAFDASSPEAKKEIKRGEVAVGFTPEQVLMAWGRPSRVYEKRTAAGAQEIWVYGLEGGPGTGEIPHSDDPGIVVSDAYFEEIRRVVFEKGAASVVVRRLR